MGAHELNRYLNYKFNYRGRNYSGYRKVQAAIQRSQFREAEVSWYEMKNGDVSDITYGKPFKAEVGFDDPPLGAEYESHTHTRYGKGNEYFGKLDINSIQNEGNQYKLEGYKVYGWKKVYVLTNDKVYSVSPSQSFLGIQHNIPLYYLNIFMFNR